MNSDAQYSATLWEWSPHLIFPKMLNYSFKPIVTNQVWKQQKHASTPVRSEFTLQFAVGVFHTWRQGVTMRHPAVWVTWLLTCAAGRAAAHQMCVTECVCPVDGVQRAAGQPVVVHWHRGRPLPSPSRLLPGPPGDWEDGYHQLPGESNGFYQSPGDSSASRKRHGRQVTQGTATDLDLLPESIYGITTRLTLKPGPVFFFLMLPNSDVMVMVTAAVLAVLGVVIATGVLGICDLAVLNQAAT